MYSGRLNALLVPKFFYAETDIPFSPDLSNDCQFLWKWDRIFDSSIDIVYDLPQKSFVSAISICLLDGSAVSSAEILADGKLSGFYYAETGKTFSGSHTVTVGAVCRTVTVRIKGAMKDISLYPPEIFGSVDDGHPSIFPSPKSVSFIDGYVGISSINVCDDDDSAFAADFLSSRLLEEVDTPFSPDGVEVSIRKTISTEFADEEFSISVSDRGIFIQAPKRIALLYAVDTLLQLRTGNKFACADIKDKPDKPFRGIHIGLPKLENFDFVRRLFKHVLIPLRYNSVIIEFAGGMRFDRRPEISEAWLRAEQLYKEKKQPPIPHHDLGAEGTLLEKDDVRRLVGYAKELGLEVIPEVQSLSHVQYLTYAYPDIAEVDESVKEKKDLRSEDALPSDFYSHSYCPSRSKSYEIIFDVIDEIVEAVRPERYVHIGHDEIYQIGLCPLCKGKAPDELYEKHVLALYSHLKELGLGTMIWADMLTRDKRYTTVAARDRLPKDIIPLDFTWYFHTDTDTETALLERGFSVAIGNLYSSHYPRYGTRAARNGMIGGQISMWVQTDERAIGTLGKFFDMAYISQMLWRSEEYDQRLRVMYSRHIGSCVLPKLREHLHGTYPKLPKKEISISLPSHENDVLLAEPSELKKHTLISNSFTVEVSQKCDRLVFIHATLRAMPRTSWLNILKVGEYTVNYSDGSHEVIEIGYGTEILAYDTSYAAPLDDAYYRHYGYVGTWFTDPIFKGKLSSGKDMTLYSLPWDNPHPQKTILSVTYCSDKHSSTPLLLFELKGEVINHYD